MANWVFKRTESELWTVGFYDPQGKFQPESDHNVQEDAANRVHFLNGGSQVLDNSDKVREDAKLKYQLIVDTLRKELKTSIKELKIDGCVDLELGYDRRIDVTISMSSVAEEIDSLIGDILPPKDDFWEDTI